MKPVIRYRSQLLFRRSYKPARPIRCRISRLHVVAKPARVCRHRRLGGHSLAMLVSF